MNTLTIDIRKAEPRDAEAVACVHHEAWQNAYAGIIPHRALNSMIGRRGRAWWENAIRRAASVLVVEMGGDIVGYATIGRNRARELPQEGEIYELYLLPEYQGIGLGSYMFRECRSILKNSGLSGLAAWCLEDSANAVTFFRATGGMDVAEGMEDFGGRSLKKIGFVWPH